MTSDTGKMMTQASVRKCRRYTGLRTGALKRAHRRNLRRHHEVILYVEGDWDIVDKGRRLTSWDLL